jgi:glycosyltransferase involved in cell wall biosynthesis
LFYTGPMKFESITCIILAYNEEATLVPVVEDARVELKKAGFRDVDILIVDDGSIDSTGKIADDLSKKYLDVRVIHHETNRGPGSGVRTGVLNARGDIVFYHPADNQIDIKEVIAFIPKLEEFDLLVGERKSRPGYTFARMIVSKGSIFLSKLLYGLSYEDYYFIYLYRKEIFDGMRLESEGVFVVAEILIRAKARNLKIGTMSVGVYPRKFGKASCGKISVILKTFWEFMRFFVRFKLLGIK